MDFFISLFPYPKFAFVGTEWYGYIDGAIESVKRAIRQIENKYSQFFKL